jgi:uncharacterized Ntn-hydrolase superfamily protein
MPPPTGSTRPGPHPALIRSLCLLAIAIALALAIINTGPRNPSPPQTANPPGPDQPLVATYTIIAADLHKRQWGIATQSKFFGVGSVVPWAKAEIGVIASQAMANPQIGKQGLKALRSGEDPQTVLTRLLAADPQAELRQAAMLDAQGRTAVHTGTACQPFAGHRTGQHYIVLGNLLAGPEVLDALAETFESHRTQGSPLGLALAAALHAAEQAGGDRRGRQSAALLVVQPDSGYQAVDDRLIDLRVEDHPDPTLELLRLLQIHRSFYPQRWQD